MQNGFRQPASTEGITTFLGPVMYTNSSLHDGESVSSTNETKDPSAKKGTTRSRQRVITEQRRQQNRIAQKAHREKQKRRLQELTRLVGEQGLLSSHDGTAAPEDKLSEGPRDPRSTRDDGQSPGNSSDQTLSAGLSNESIVSTELLLGQSTPTQKMLSRSDGSGEASSRSDATSSHDPYSRVWPSDLLLASHQSDWQPMNPESSSGSLDRSGLIWSPIPEGQWPGASDASSSGSDSTPPIATKTLCRWLLNDENESRKLDEMLSSTGVGIRDIILAGINAYTHNPNHSPKGSSRTTVAPHALIKIPDPDRSRYLPSSYLYLADLQLNHISLPQMNTFEACVANAALLGISADELVVEEQESPFYLAHMLAPDANAARASYSGLKRDLLPTSTQLTISHPNYIDTFPFPEFRDRFIVLRSLDPPIFDEDELCNDLHDGAAICWGSSSPSGTGTPWDYRSWEIKSWFIKKWWVLTGGVGGKMYDQSRWWHEIRGERFDEIE